MARVPTYDRRQIQLVGQSARGFSMNAPDASGLTRGLAQAEASVIDMVQREREKADTARLMETETQMSEWLRTALFAPERGVYTKKGRNALDVTNQTLQQFDAKAVELENSLTNEQQRLRWKNIMGGQRNRLAGDLNRYEFGERESYYDDVDKGQLESAVQGAMLYANDPQRVAYYQNKANAVLGAQALRKGLPAELAEQNRTTFNSNLMAGVTTSLMKSAPYQAQQYFAQNKVQMTAEDQARVSGMLKPVFDRQMGRDIARGLLSGGGDDFRTYWAAQRGAESGNRQFDSNGQPLTSKAGAVGVAQVMEATGPEAAALAGLSWDRERWLNDRDYNEALGMAYSRKQFQDFQDPILALAAYNAGPGAVQKAIKDVGDPRTGAITHEQFMQALPRETQGYVAKIMRNAPTPSLASSSSDMYAAGLIAAQALPEGDVKSAAIAELENFKKTAEAQQRAVYEAAADQVAQLGYNGIDPQTLGALSGEDRVKLRKLDDDLRKGTEPATDYAKLEEFLGMPAAKLGELSLARDIRPYLSNSDFKTVQTAWQQAKKGDDTPQKIAQAEEETLARVMNMAGILTGDNKDARHPKNIEKQQRFRAAYQARIDSALTKVKTLSLEDRQALAEQLLLEVRLREPVRVAQSPFPGLEPVEQSAVAAAIDYRFFDSQQPLWEVTPERMADVYINESDIEIDDIPPSDRAEIVRVLREGGQPVSEPMIKAYYFNRMSSMGLPVR